jgi:hypothetical protein
MPARAQIDKDSDTQMLPMAVARPPIPAPNIAILRGIFAWMSSIDTIEEIYRANFRIEYYKNTTYEASKSKKKYEQKF